MKKLIILLLAIMIIFNFADSFAFSDKVKREAEKFMSELNKIALSEGVVKEGPVNLEKEEKLSKRLTEFYNSLPYDEEMMLNITRYFYSKDTPEYNLLGLNMFEALKKNKWEKNYSKQEILLNKLLPIAITNTEPNDLRIEVLHKVGGYLDFKNGILKELTPEQIEQVRDSLKRIVLDSEYNLPEEKRKYGDVFNVRTQAIDLLAGNFDIDNNLLKRLLELFDVEKDEWTKKKIIWGLSTAYRRGHISKEGQKIFYSRLTEIAEHADKYNEDIQFSSFTMITWLGEKEGLDFISSLMRQTNNLAIFQKSKYAFDNYYKYSQQIYKNEYKLKAREILKQRINDDNSEIRRFCIEEISKEIKEMDKDAKKELSGLFLKAKQKEKDKRIIELLDKGISEAGKR